MAYSNTNKDNKQVDAGNSVKSILFAILLTVVGVSSLVNVYNQWSTLSSAIKLNQEMDLKIKQLENENRQLTRQIEYATSSAYINRATRQYLGLGNENDYWLIMPQKEGEEELKQEVNETVEKPTIIQWWDLFTK